jgi:Na+/H+-dicarboxylate symporter
MDAAPKAASRSMRSRMLAASLPFWVLVGASLGILTGLTFGERAAVLKPLGIVYAMMLESVVYPYILSSLIVGLGSLAGRERGACCRQAGPYTCSCG